MEVDAKKSADCIPLDEASLKIYDNMIKVRQPTGRTIGVVSRGAPLAALCAFSTLRLAFCRLAPPRSSPPRAALPARR